MFCRSCGAQIPDGSANCSVCGAAQMPAQPTYQQPTYQQPTYQQPMYQQPYQQPIYGAKPVIPGKGMGIASLVLGIIGLFYGFFSMIGIFSLVDSWYYSPDIEDFIGLIIFLLGVNIPAVALGVASKNKGYHGVNNAGIVTGIIGLVLSVLSMIILAAA